MTYECDIICDLMWQADIPSKYIYKTREALEKQIPKRKHKYSGFRCVCGELVAKNQDYCEYCGQRLEEWKE